MNLFSYTVSRDFGFAPNPFDGFCTLATCKLKIRQTANIGDWVVGTGSKARGMAGNLVYAMRVDEIMGFQKYWEDPRFRTRRPQLNGSLKKLYGTISIIPERRVRPSVALYLHQGGAR